MRDFIGRTLGLYRITDKLGEGGMGKVYKARDTKLDREVAIKVLPEEVAEKPDRLARFEQEAKSLAGLNHPNIVTIFSVEEAEGTRFIAMELVEGKTLREILSEGPLPAKKLLNIVTQIADGLAKAHAAGIIHRDLKPENIMVTSDGFVKILDFGLAKLVFSDLGVTSEAVTMTRGVTIPGAVMGTVGYMSPEQAKGDAVDFRSDQFALGAILYEMATGKRAFKRDTAPETLTATIRETPEPLAVVNANLPFHLHLIVGHCLAKNPEERYDSTRDLARELRSVLEGLDHAGRTASTVTKAPTRIQETSLGKALSERIAHSQLSMKNNINHITFKRSDEIADVINDVVKKIPCDLDEVFFANQGIGEITIVCESDKERLFESILAQALEIRDDAAVIRIRDLVDDQVMPSVDVRGLYSFFINQVSNNGVNILDIISTRTTLTIVVDEENLSRAYYALNESIRDLRNKEKS